MTMFRSISKLSFMTCVILFSVVFEGIDCKDNKVVKQEQVLSVSSTTLSPANASVSVGNEIAEELKEVANVAETMFGGEDFGGVADENGSATYRSSDASSAKKGRDGDNRPYHGIGIIPWTVLITISCLMFVGAFMYRRWQRNYRLTRFGNTYSTPAYLSGDENILL